jgi:hypothetical protein
VEFGARACVRVCGFRPTSFIPASLDRDGVGLGCTGSFELQCESG